MIDELKCSVCGEKLHGIGIDPCYSCTYDDPLFWCYTHEHFSHDRIKCQKCLNDKNIKNQKGRLIGLWLT